MKARGLIRFVAALLAPGALVVGLGAGLTASGDAGQPRDRARHASVPAIDGLKPCRAGGAPGFAHYFAGLDFEGLPLTAAMRNCDAPVQGEAGPGRSNDVDYVYGDCDVIDNPDHDGGCLFPLEVRTSPACEDNLSLYYRYPQLSGKPVPFKRTEIRGVPAASFEQGRRLELYTGDATVRVMGDDPDQVRRAALDLRSGPPDPGLSLNVDKLGAGVPQLKDALARPQSASEDVLHRVLVGVDDALPQPLAGAIQGRLAC